MSYQQQFRPTGLRLLPPIIKNLLIINVLFYLGTIALGRAVNYDLVQIFGLHFLKADHFKIWQFVSYMFMHDPNGISHILFNMFALWMFGSALENTWGGKRFLNYYLITGIGAGLVHLLVTYIRISMILPDMNAADIAMVYEQSSEIYSGGQRFVDATMHQLSMLINTPTVGASGAVFGLLLAFGMTFPNSMIYVYFAIPIRAKYFVMLYGAAELFFGFSNRAGDNVAHFAHLGGMIFGFILIKYWSKKLNKPKRFY